MSHLPGHQTGFSLQSFLQTHAKIDRPASQLNLDSDLANISSTDPEKSSSDCSERVELEEFNFDNLESRLLGMKTWIPQNNNSIIPALSNAVALQPADAVMSTPTPEESCEQLEDRLLDGALKNLDYFPQLLREVQRVKKEREEQMRIDEERRKAAAQKAELERSQRDRARKAEAERRHGKALVGARKLLKEEVLHELQSSLDEIYRECDELNKTNDALQYEISFNECQTHRLSMLEERLQKALAQRAENHVVMKTYEGIIGIPRQKICTAKGQEKLVQLARMNVKQAKELTTLDETLDCLTAAKKKLFKNKMPDPVCKDFSRTKQEVQKSLDALEADKNRLGRLLDQYRI